MADNVDAKTAANVPVATDVVTHSGDASQNVQLVRPVLVTGAEGSKTVVDLPGDNANGLDVDVTRLPALPAGSNNIGDVDVLSVPADPFGANADAASASGSISAKLRFIATTGIPQTGSGIAVGDIAHDAADSGAPIKAGAVAIAGQSTATLVAAADRSNLYCGTDGVLITRPHCGLEDIVSGNASNTDGSSFQVIAAGGSGIFQHITTIVVTNTSTAAIFVEIKDGATAKMTIPVPAQGGATVNLPVPLKGSANTAWNCDPSAATTTVYCSMVGFKSKV